MATSVLIIGGGPAGISCAIELRRLGHEVLLVERRGSPRFRLAETCSGAARRVLEDLCKQAFPASAFHPLTTISSSWGSPNMEGRSLSFWHAAEGAIVDRAALDTWMVEAAMGRGVDVKLGTQVVGGGRADGQWQVFLRSLGRIRSTSVNFVIEATGRTARSVLETRATRVFTDRLICISIALPVRTASKSTVMIEACSVGWWFSAHSSRIQVLSLFTDGDLLPPRRMRYEFLTSVMNTTSHICHMCRHPLPSTPFEVRDARSSVRMLQFRDGWLSIGDAAASLDPLSGAGIERAVMDGMQAANVVSTALNTGDTSRLREYVYLRTQNSLYSLRLQREYYRLEDRWQQAVFWQRRV